MILLPGSGSFRHGTETELLRKISVTETSASGYKYQPVFITIQVILTKNLKNKFTRNINFVFNFF